VRDDSQARKAGRCARQRADAGREQRQVEQRKRMRAEAG
jgi:hypothetical protein